MTEEPLFTTATKLIHQARQEHKVPESHLDPKTRVVCPNNFNTIEDIRYWLGHNPGRHVVCDGCQNHNHCCLELEAYLELAREARNR